MNSFVELSILGDTFNNRELLSQIIGVIPFKPIRKFYMNLGALNRNSLHTVQCKHGVVQFRTARISTK